MVSYDYRPGNEKLAKSIVDSLGMILAAGEPERARAMLHELDERSGDFADECAENDR